MAFPHSASASSANPSASSLPALTQASAERYRAIADSSFDLICELDAEGCFSYVSPSFGVTTGLDPHALQGTSLFDRVPDGDRETLVAEYTAALAGTRVGRAEHRFEHFNGDFHWFESALRGIGARGERRVVIVSREITARQRHQVELETLISLAKSVHSKNELPAIAREIWHHLHPLLPATALLLVLPGAARDADVHVVGQTPEGSFEQLLSRTNSPNCPLWSALERPEVWLENSWNGGHCGFDFPVRSLVAVPLRADELEPGALFFAAAKPFVWTEEHVRLCLMAGEQAAVAARGVELLQSAREAEARYRALVNDVEGIVWETGERLRLAFVSEQIEGWLGYPAAQWLEDSRLWLRAIHPEDRRRVGAELRENLALPASWQIEFRALSRDGREMWLRLLATPEVQDGRVVKVRGLAVDFTERCRHLETILKSNAILAATQEASADGICLVDPHGDVVSLNTRFAEMWHIPPALVEELRDRRQLMACVLSLMRQPEEFVEKMNLLRQNPEASSRDIITLRDGRIFERYSAPALAAPVPLAPGVALKAEVENGFEGAMVRQEVPVGAAYANGAHNANARNGNAHNGEANGGARKAEVNGNVHSSEVSGNARKGDFNGAAHSDSNGAPHNGHANGYSSGHTGESARLASLFDLGDEDELEAQSGPSAPFVLADDAPELPSFGRVWTFSDVTERKHYEERLEHRAFHDPLTELPNRSLFMNRVEQALARLDRRGKALAILFFDLDRFKVVNDTMGHEKGDWLLQEIGKRLHGLLRPGDTAARFGGDEFTLLLEDLNGIDDARVITERLIEALELPLVLEGREFEVTASIGVAMSFSRSDSAGDLLRNADIAMYRAKNKGKARYEIFDTKMSAAALSRLQLEIELRQAVKLQQLRLDYQPLMDLSSDRIIGMEALVRWEHPDKGIIPPDDFIPIAEESGMISPIGQWVLKEACRQAKKWQTQFPLLWPLKMSVNLSARQFQGNDIVQDIADVLEDTELPAFCLELEITETAVMEDADATILILEKLRDLGVKLAIDDFGTGYSSLAYIERFPLDSLKIDRSFVQTIGKTRNGKAKKERSVIMKAVQTMGQGLGIEITAEGIETGEQLAELRDMGCAVGQGFLFAKPLSSVSLTRMLREKSDAEIGVTV